MDMSPPWLLKFDRVQAGSDSDEIVVDISDLETNPSSSAEVVKVVWTAPQLRRLKKSLENKIKREKARLEEMSTLREECIQLTLELEALRQKSITVSVPG